MKKQDNGVLCMSIWATWARWVEPDGEGFKIVGIVLIKIKFYLCQVNTRQQTERKAKAGKAVEDVESALAFAKAHPTKDLQKGTLHEIWKVRMYSLLFQQYVFAYFRSL